MHHEFLYNSHQMKSSYRKYNYPGNTLDSLKNEEIEEKILQGDYEPSCTSVTHRRAKTIDYIFYSSKYLKLNQCKSLPTEEELRSEEGEENWQDNVKEMKFNPNQNYNGLPNTKWGSDHIPIMASFNFK